MKKLLTLFLSTIAFGANAQTALLKAGDRFPDIAFHTVLNAPMKNLDLNNYPSRRFIIINFWGTWCSPCIPEMDALAKLQTKYQQQIQVIGYADDPKAKLVKYLAKKPSGIWLVSDTSYLLYKMLSLASVGHAMILDAKKNIVAVVKTDSVNEKMIGRLLKGEQIKSNAEISEVTHAEKDAFGVDSLLGNSFTVRGYMTGQQTMGKNYQKGPYAGRRRSYYNVTPTIMYKDAYGISSQKQVVYEYDVKKYENFSDKTQLYCFDLLVSPEGKDSLKLIMQRKLNESLPVKGRLETRTITVYVLKLRDGKTANIPVTKSSASTYMFSGNGYSGTDVTVDEFTKQYLNNELDLPVVNETGLSGHYDIETQNDMRDKSNLLAAIDKLGFALEKAERPMTMLVLYRQPIVGYITGTYK